MKIYKFYEDPGHGWLAVKLKELKDLGIMDKISQCSYFRGQTAYLEEDVDAGTFIKAMRAKGLVLHEDFVFENKRTDKSSPIRSYPRYNDGVNSLL